MSSKKEDKVVTSKSISKSAPVIVDGLQEVELLKDHGVNKKGEKVLKHPNTAELLIKAKIAK